MDYDELVQRLRSAKAWLYLENTQEWSDSYNDYSDAPTEAADALVQLQARVAELTEGRDNWAALCAATGEDLRECRADLAAARALLLDARRHIRCQYGDEIQCANRIDAALALALAGKDAT